MSSIIVPYENPDLDGVACAIALAAFEPTIWEAKIIGHLDAETIAVLDYLKIDSPTSLLNYDEVSAIWLVDTHYLQMAPVPMPALLVAKVTDHHPAGSGPILPNALVQNEAVGAAATLVAELYDSKNIRIVPKLAILLQCAILSNTLDFRASASTVRDRRAFQSLSTIQSVDEELRVRMQRAKEAFLDNPSGTIFESGVKRFVTPDGPVVISQVEAPGASVLLARTDLDAVLIDTAAAENARAVIWNIVDTNVPSSTVLCTDLCMLQKISTAIGHAVGADRRLTVSRILQRKTDIVPFVVP